MRVMILSGPEREETEIQDTRNAVETSKIDVIIRL
jgi:hypothetical protein